MSNDTETETRYRELFEASPHPMLVYDPASQHIRYANRAAAQTYGYTRTRLHELTLEELYAEPERPALRRLAATIDGAHHVGVWTHQRADGSPLDVEVTANDLWIDGHRYRMVLVQLISDRREARLHEQRRLQRTSRQEHAVARLAADPVLGAGDDPEAALARICRTANETLRVHRTSFWRFVDDPPGLVCESLYDATDAGATSAGQRIDGTRCPAYLAAVGSGRAIDAFDARHDPRTREFADDYLTPQGITSVLDSAVRLHGRVHGVLCHEHIGPPRRWLADEIRFAGELADQAAQALLNAERERHQRLLHFIASGVAPGTGVAFFELLVARLGEALSASVVHVAEITDDEASAAATIIAGWSRDGSPPHGAYPLAGSPCARTLTQDLYLIARRVAEHFPDDEELLALRAQAYLGIRLSDAANRVIGVLVAVFDRPLDITDEPSSLMRIFAVRAASELERMRAEARLRLAATVLENAGEGILVADEHGRIVESNPAYRRMSAREPMGVTGRSLLPLLCDDAARQREIADALGETGSGRWEGEIDCQRRDGSRFPAWLSVSRLDDDQASGARFIAMIGDITEVRASQAELRYLAHHDPLTGLPNRLALRERLDHSLRLRSADAGGVALLFIDLDGFKDVNDSLGHTEGDEVLKVIARRLTEHVRSNDLLARVGGDEFMLLLAHPAAADRARQLAERLINSLDVPFLAAGRPIYVTASVGIAAAPEHGDDAETLIRAADAAMYLAKAEGRNTARVFQPELSHRAYHRIATAGALRSAIDDGRLFLEYQPIVELQSGELVACEALIRWRGDDGGIVSPREFIPVAESSGLVVPVSRWVFQTACRQMRAWLDAGIAPRRVAVNVSPAHLQQGDLVADLRRAITEAGIEPHHLIVEITEGLIMQAPGHVTEALAALRAMDVDLAVDDFGTGYSSLAYLKRLPLSTLKLDKSLTHDLPDDTDSAAIARAILAMAHSLGLRVIAEGIETEVQLAFLNHEGCRFGQGFLFGRPAEANVTRPLSAAP